jgi:hypothetical protein
MREKRGAAWNRIVSYRIAFGTPVPGWADDPDLEALDEYQFYGGATLKASSAWAYRWHLLTGKTKPDDPALLFTHSHESTGDPRPGARPLSVDKDLLSGWILPVVESTLAGWVRDPAKLKDLRWTMPGDEPSLSPVEVPGCTYVFHCKAWDPESERPGAARKRILKDVWDQLKAKMNEQKQAQVLAGRKKAPRKVDPEQFDRLVLYQVVGWSIGRISKEHLPRCARQTISKSLKKAAELVIGPAWETWLRRDPVGRPRRP